MFVEVLIKCDTCFNFFFQAEDGIRDGRVTSSDVCSSDLPLWMAQLLVGIVLVLQSHYIRPEYFTKEFSLFPAWPRFDYERALQLFELTIFVLLAPKFLDRKSVV